MSEVAVSLPPLITALDPEVQARTVVAMEEALREITVLDRTHGNDLAAVGSMLLRTESVASSKIDERLALLRAEPRFDRLREQGREDLL